MILDDEEGQIHYLRELLEQNNYEVPYLRNIKSAREYLEKQIVQILLIDASLYPSSRDKAGIEFATQCASEFPEAPRICISRESIVQIKVTDILNAMNPQTDNDNQELRVPDSSGRVLWAFGEKTKPGGIIELVERLRRRTTCAERAKMFLDPELEKDWNEHFKRIIDTKPQAIEPHRQFVEIVKGLAYRSAIPEVGEILLEKIGKSRSRTLVAKMTLRFESKHCPLQFVVKIGAPDLIDKEVSNYKQYVPQFLNYGQYPQLENTVRSRQLAGISYGLLGRIDEQNLPPTLGDLIKSGKLGGNELHERIEEIFGSMIAEEYKNVERPKTLKEDFGDRFRALSNEADSVNAEFVKNMNVLGGEDFRLVIPQGDSFKLPEHQNRSLTCLKSLLEGSIAFEANSTAIVHGDLHVDNIVFFNTKNWSQFFFIDFSHSCPHNIFLDHVVMELGCRFQLVSEVLKPYTGADTKTLRELYKKLLNFELALCDRVDACSTNLTEPAKTDDLKFLYDLICQIRGAAASRWSKEPAERYLGAVGLTCAAALRLKIPEALETSVRMWFTIASTVNLTAYEMIKKKMEAEKKVDPNIALWNYRTERTPSQRLQAAVESRSNELQMLFVELIRHVWMVDDSAYKRELTGLKNVQSELRDIQNEYPDLFNKLTELFNRVLKKLNDEEVAIAKEIGWTGLFLQLRKFSRTIELPEKFIEIFKKYFKQNPTDLK
jgi:CheY-like chemotaxis protein